ncbi:hypothetical protein EDC96DRAFT_550051 [Choanephora cucurbitarum]|nr:hypothetical protein EDC96DRAFT_550051 [Choanephora cucurbitarum]
MNANISINKETIDRKIDTSFAKVVKSVRTKKAALKVNKLFKLFKGLSSGSVANGDDDLQKRHRERYLSEACPHALNFYRSNPSELERVVAERMQVVTNKKLAKNTTVQLLKKLMASFECWLNINQSTLGQCLQNYLCARQGHKISGHLSKVEDAKERRVMEKNFRLQLTDKTFTLHATGQSKFYKHCMSAHKMQTIVSSDVLLLVDVATPDIYRKIKYGNRFDICDGLLYLNYAATKTKQNNFTFCERSISLGCNFGDGGPSRQNFSNYFNSILLMFTNGNVKRPTMERRRRFAIKLFCRLSINYRLQNILHCQTFS